MLLIPGEYYIRASFGKDAARRIRFTVIACETTQLHAPFPDSPACNGVVLVNLPEGLLDDCDAYAYWRPEWADKEWRVEGPPFYFWGTQPRCRITDGRLHVEALPVDEPLVVRISFHSEREDEHRTWRTTITKLNVTSGRPTPVEAKWTLEEE
jgi:hypothetical protein